MYIPLPKGYVVGDRIRTNATYALVNPRIKEPRYGVITNGSHTCLGLEALGVRVTQMLRQ
jgi:hypothetical protein